MELPVKIDIDKKESGREMWHDSRMCSGFPLAENTRNFNWSEFILKRRPMQGLHKIAFEMRQ